MEKFLVIGSNSFSGSNFCSLLMRQGYEVFGVSRSAEVDQPFRPYNWHSSKSGSFQFQQLNINFDLEEFVSILKRFKPQFIVNFAAQSMVAQSWDYPRHWLETNVMAITNILDILKSYDGLEKYVQITTPEVYGSSQSLISEDAILQPSTPYAVSRAAGDMMLRIYQQEFGLPVNFTRAANVYGPGQQLYRVIPRTILACFTGEKLVLDGGGLSERAFIHIEDVSEATLAIAKSAKVGETFHVSTNKFISIKSLVEQIVSIAGVNFEEIVSVGEERRGKDQAYYLDSTKLRTQLGWSDKISLENGISETIDWIKNNLGYFQSLKVGYVHKP